MRLVISSLVSMVLVLSALASGTTIVIGFSKNKIVIASDSRLTNEDGTYTDTTCKIVPLGDKFLFADSGRARDVTNGVVGWDVDEQAKSALAEVSKRQPDPRRSFAGDVADRWLDIVGPSIVSHIRPLELAKLKLGQGFVNGMFAGLGPAGDAQVAYATIRRSANPVSPMESPPITVYPTPDAMAFAQQGAEEELFREFFQVTSARAKTEHQKTMELSKTWSPDEADARFAIRLVELIIQYDTDNYVGGPVDAVELKKGGFLRWIQRKKNCSDH